MYLESRCEELEQHRRKSSFWPPSACHKRKGTASKDKTPWKGTRIVLWWKPPNGLKERKGRRMMDYILHQNRAKLYSVRNQIQMVDTRRHDINFITRGFKMTLISSFALIMSRSHTSILRSYRGEVHNFGLLHWPVIRKCANASIYEFLRRLFFVGFFFVFIMMFFLLSGEMSSLSSGLRIILLALALYCCQTCVGKVFLYLMS